MTESNAEYDGLLALDRMERAVEKSRPTAAVNGRSGGGGRSLCRDRRVRRIETVPDEVLEEVIGRLEALLINPDC